MRAIIDIGTNSVRLLLAEKDDKDEWKVLKKDLRKNPPGRGEICKGSERSRR